MITAVAEATQTDPAMAGTSAISALSACAGGNVEIQIRDGWIEPLCTYSVAVADSGERKSAVQRPMLKPVLDAEAELVEAIMPRHVDAVVKKDIAEKALQIAIAKAVQDAPVHARMASKPRMTHSTRGMPLTPSTFQSCHGWSPTMSHPRRSHPAARMRRINRRRLRRGRRVRHHRRPLQRQHPESWMSGSKATAAT